MHGTTRTKTGSFNDTYSTNTFSSCKNKMFTVGFVACSALAALHHFH